MIRLANPDGVLMGSTATLFEVHRCCERSSELFEAWAQLAQLPMEHPCWLMNWWNLYRSGDPRTELFLVSVRDPQRLIAIAPLYLDNGVLRLLGDGRACTDHLELLIGRWPERGVVEQRIEELLDWLACGAVAKRWTRIELESLRLGGPTQTVCEKMKDRLWVHQQDAAPTCEISLPKTWDAYLAGLSKNHRKRCRRWLRDDVEDGQMETISTRTGWNRDEAFETLVCLHNQRRQESAHGLFAHPHFTQFLKAAFEDLSDRGMAEISALRRGEQVLAVELEFHHQDTTFAYQSGLADAGLQCSGGSISLLRRIHAAIENGRSTYDLMRGDEAYKFHWGAVRQSNVRLQIRPLTTAGYVSHRRAALWDVSKELLKSWMRSMTNISIGNGGTRVREAAQLTTPT